MNRRISETLELRDLEEGRKICCRGCGRPIAAAGASWKSHAAFSAIPVAKLPGAPSAVHPDVVYRRFSCPGCGKLLDCETALPDDPFLDDVVSA